MSHVHSKIIPLAIIPSVFISFFHGKIILITFICMLPIFIYFFNKFYIKRSNNTEIDKGKQIIKLFIFYNIFIVIRGISSIKDSNDFSNIFGNIIFYSLTFPLIIYYLNLCNFTTYVRQYIIYGIIATIIIAINGAGSGSMDVPHTISGLYIIGLMLPYLNKKWYFIIILTLVLVLLTNLGTRTNIINFTAYICLLLLSYSKQILLRTKKILSIILITMPIFFLILGLSGVFNIFKIGDIYQTSILISGGIKSGERELLVDSRTSIYEDVFNELKKENAYLIGLGANGKTETSLSDINNADFDKIYKSGRSSTESGMLNQIQYGGAFGFISYSLLFIYAVYLAIWESKNKYITLIGLFVAYKYTLSFIEDCTSTNINYLFIMIAIALCYNKKIRNFNNKEMEIYCHQIFKIKGNGI